MVKFVIERQAHVVSDVDFVSRRPFREEALKHRVLCGWAWVFCGACGSIGVKSKGERVKGREKVRRKHDEDIVSMFTTKMKGTGKKLLALYPGAVQVCSKRARDTFAILSITLCYLDHSFITRITRDRWSLFFR